MDQITIEIFGGKVNLYFHSEIVKRHYEKGEPHNATIHVCTSVIEDLTINSIPCKGTVYYKVRENGDPTSPDDWWMDGFYLREGMLVPATSSQTKKFQKEVLSFITNLFREDPLLSNKIVIKTISEAIKKAEQEVDKASQELVKKQQKVGRMINTIRDFEQLENQDPAIILRKFAEL